MHIQYFEKALMSNILYPVSLILNPSHTVPTPMKIRVLVKSFSLSLLCLMVACGPTEEPANDIVENISLEGTIWQLVQINTTGNYVFTPEDPSAYTLQFRTENRLTGKSDCNRLTGAWTQQDNALNFEPFSSSRSLCLPGSLHNHFMSNLMNVDAFETTAGSLILSTTIPGVTLELEQLVNDDI